MVQKTKVEIIEETANFYNLTNRAVADDGNCVYKTADGKMCAVGRCLMDDFVIDSNAQYSVCDLFNDNDDDDSIFLKEEYRGHSEDFWSGLQCFHDKNQFFTTEGLSEEGIVFKNILLKNHGKYNL